MASAICTLLIALLVPAFIHGAAKISDCGGADKIIAFKEGSVSPDPVEYPGSPSLSVVMDVLEDLPASDVEVKVDLYKLDPTRAKVPCLDTIGSCSYDICQIIEEHSDDICPMFPDPEDCGCPLKSKLYDVKDAKLAIPDMGEAFAAILEGKYEGNITVIDKATNALLGCCAIAFEVIAAS